MTTHIAELADRGVVAVTGAEAAGFLNGLVTSDVAALEPGRAGYAALLTPQGKILFDFLALRTADGFLLDAPRALVPDLVKRLKFYRLRARIEIADLSAERAVLALWGERVAGLAGILYDDPRLAGLGQRLLATPAEFEAALAAPGSRPADPALWHAHRIALAVPEGGRDFAYGEAFPHDADMDDLGGVDFAKGCYVGQEVVSRMKHRGTARRRVLPVTSVDGADLPAPGTEIRAGDRPVGTLGSAAGAEGLALVRIDRVRAAIEAGTPITAGLHTVTLRLPAWARFGWPATEAAD